MGILCTAADILMDEESRLSDAAHVCSDENRDRCSQFSVFGRGFYHVTNVCGDHPEK